MQLANPKNDYGAGSNLGSHSVVQTPSFLHLQPQAVIPSVGQGTLVKQSQVNAGKNLTKQNRTIIFFFLEFSVKSHCAVLEPQTQYEITELKVSFQLCS